VANDSYTYSVLITAPATKKVRVRIQFYNSSSDRTSVTTSNWIEAGQTGISKMTSTLTSTQAAYAQM